MASSAVASVAVETHGPGGIKRGQTRFVRWGKKLRPLFNRVLGRYSLVGDTPTYDPRLFSWTAELVAAVPSIREEADRIMQRERAIPPFRDFAPGHERIVSADDWRSFFFYGYGYPVPENLARCPATAAAVRQVPGLISAIYSVVKPGAHIRRHRGVSKAVMTAHIPLRVPRDAAKCRMDVAGEQAVWQVGQAYVFDDTYDHEVWNDADETRVVLLIQFRRPMRQPGRALAGLLVWLVRRSAFVQRARNNPGYWEKAFAAAERTPVLNVSPGR